MEYGYCRISRATQNIERQVRNIATAYPQAHIVKEAYTGTKIQGRKELDKILNMVKCGDTIIFDSVSRMSRNAAEGVALYEELYNRNIELVFLKERHINTSVYRDALQNQIDLTGNEIADEYIRATNRVLMILARKQIELAFEQAQKEVDDLHQRTSEGIMTAKLNGKQIGRISGRRYVTRKEKNCLEIIKRLSKDFDGGNSDIEVIAITGLCRNTFYKYKNILKQNIESGV